MKTKLLLLLLLVATSLGTRAQDFPFQLPDTLSPETRAMILELFKPSIGDTLTTVIASGDGELTLRIYAPEANKVSITGEVIGMTLHGPTCTRDEQGIWTGVVSNVKPGVYTYQFIVDGVRANDPRAKSIVNGSSVIEYDPQGDAFWAERDVPHGTISAIYYPSTTTGTTRRMHVWTPAGYNQATDPLPVLYLIHGGGDTDVSWSTTGRAGFILDNLLANGEMVPMIVVMPNGGMDTSLFTDELMNDIIPYVEQNFRTLTDAGHRAVAGLSMGGLETLDILLRHYNSFAYVFPMSTGWFAGTGDFEKWEPYIKEHADEMNKAFKAFTFFMGGETDIAYHNCVAVRALFEKYGVRHEYSSMEGGHSWHVWKSNLHDIAPVLFK